MGDYMYPILLVEDSDVDYIATERALLKKKIANPLYRCARCEEAWDYLLNQGKFNDPHVAPRPGLIILDLNMPGLDGRDFLIKLKQHHILKQIPVIVFTTSDDSRDINACYEGGANSYVKKPNDIYSLINTIKIICDYWFKAVRLPDVINEVETVT